MQFGDVLRKLLEEKSITQKQLAENLNISASTLGNYIRNLRQPDFEMVRKIADYFSVSTDYLLDHHGIDETSALECELLRVFRAMSSEYREIYIEQGKAFVERKQ